MVALSPAVQPTAAITTAGAIVAVPMHGKRESPLKRIVVVQQAGAAASYSVTVSSDPACVDLAKRIAAFSNATPTDPVDFEGPYSRDIADTLYVRIVPNAGTDNVYSVKLFVDDGF